MTLSTPTRPWFTEPEDTYFTYPNSWGSSDARLVLSSPLLAKMSRNKEIPRKDSPALTLGTAWDQWITGNRMPSIAPANLDRRTKEGKAWWEANADKTVLTAEQGEAMERMMANCKPGLVNKFPAETVFQQVIRVESKPNVLFQSRMDAFTPCERTIVDVKTTGKPLTEFGKSAFNFGYHIQAGWYRMCARMAGLGTLDFHFLVTETVPPYRTSLFKPDEAFLALGDAKAEEAARTIEMCVSSGHFPSNFPEVTTLSLPKWVGQSETPSFEE